MNSITKAIGATLLVIALLLLPDQVSAQGIIEKTYCTSAVGFESIERIKIDLLNNAKQLAVTEIYGEFIAAWRAVSNSVLTIDEILSSSAGYVHVSGDAEFYNGTSFAEVCVMIRAFATQDDLKLVEPQNLKKRVCLAREGMAAEELADLVKEESVLQALYDYDPRLAEMERKQVQQLMRELTYHESDFLKGTTTYCAEVEGQVTPIEVLAFVAAVDSPVVETPQPVATPEPETQIMAATLIPMPTPTKTPIGNTPPDSVLSSGATWYQDGMTMRVYDFHLEQDSCTDNVSRGGESWSVWRIAISNKLAQDLVVNLEELDWYFVDNAGTPYSLYEEGGFVIVTEAWSGCWPNLFRNRGRPVIEILEAGETVTMTAHALGSIGNREWFDFGVRTAGRIENAAWRFEIPR